MIMRALLFSGLITLSGCKPQEARRPITQNRADKYEKSVERTKKRYNAEVEAIQSIINALPELNFSPSQSGFWFTTFESDDPEAYRPQFGDTVIFDLSIANLSGNLIYPEIATANQVYVMDQEVLFKGLREGLKLMSVGQKAEFLIPSQLAYGYYGDGDLVGPNLPLRCKVHLKKITQNKN